MNRDLRLTPTNPDVLAVALASSQAAWSAEETDLMSLSHHLLPLNPPHIASQKFLFNHSQLETIPHQVITILHPRSHVQWSQNIWVSASSSIKVGWGVDNKASGVVVRLQ